MFVEERQQQILEHLHERGKVTVEELSARFNVSAPTVRADLASLEGRRLLRRTHGGALPVETSLYEPPYAERAGANTDEKRRIGRAAAALVRPGETVILDAGTTTHEVGLALIELGIQGVTVVTNNLPTAMALMDASGIEVIVVGGQIHARRRATLGALAVGFLEPLYADRVFLGVSGVDVRAGLTAADFDAVHVKRTMLAHAREVAVVADASKIGQTAFAHIAPLNICSLLITDAVLDEEEESALLEAGIPEIRCV